MVSSLLNKRLQALRIVGGFFFGFGLPSASKDGSILVQGTVVAIQRGETDARLIEPGSLADLAEIYMVRADRRFPSTRKETYVLIEDVHHTGLIPYEEFDKTHWNFELRQYSAEENQDCLSWLARADGFMPTGFGAQVKLPDPKTLPCFLMVKQVTPAR